MAKAHAGTEAHWALAHQAFKDGLSYRAIAEKVFELEGQGDEPPPSIAVIRRKAIAQEWTRDNNGRGTLGPAVQTTEMREKRIRDFRASGQLNLAKRLELLVDQLGEACTELVSQMFEPMDVVEVKVLSEGAHMGQMIQVQRTRINEPTPKDKQALASAASSLIDRIQLLSGGATSRSEIGPIADRAQAEAKLRMIRDELAERRTVEENAETARRLEATP